MIVFLKFLCHLAYKFKEHQMVVDIKRNIYFPMLELFLSYCQVSSALWDGEQLWLFWKLSLSVHVFNLWSISVVFRLSWSIFFLIPLAMSSHRCLLSSVKWPLLASQALPNSCLMKRMNKSINSRSNWLNRTIIIHLMMHTLKETAL